MTVSIFWSCSENEIDTDLTSDSITLSQNVIDAGEEGAIVDVKVTSSGDWRVSGSCDWARPSVNSGVDGESISFVVDASTTDQARETTFKVFTGSAIAIVEITSAPTLILEIVSPSSVNLSKSSHVLVVEIRSNIVDINFDFSGSGAEWITFKERVDAFGKSILRFDIAENETYSVRNSTITISALDIRHAIAVTQNQIDAVLINTLEYEFDLTERILPIDIEANVDYTVTSNSDWITEVPATRALVKTTYQFHLDAAIASRVGSITIEGNGETYQIEVAQKDPNVVPVVIPDDAFRNWLEIYGWIVMVGDEYVITEVGVTATELSYSLGYGEKEFVSVEGIGAFTSLQTIDLAGHDLKIFDISNLTQVTNVNINENGLEEIHLGANAIESLEIPNLFTRIGYSYIPRSTLVTGSKLKSLNLNYDKTYMDPYDELRSVDISGCSALETFNCVRDWNVLETIYLKEGQVIPNMDYTYGADISYL